MKVVYVYPSPDFKKALSSQQGFYQNGSCRCAEQLASEGCTATKQSVAWCEIAADLRSASNFKERSSRYDEGILSSYFGQGKISEFFGERSSHELGGLFELGGLCLTDFQAAPPR